MSDARHTFFRFRPVFDRWARPIFNEAELAWCEHIRRFRGLDSSGRKL